ncbi:hypothetical protein FHW23_001164 [Curtobacterium pusillum]|uniref:Protein NO VEIN C-terminal domain-containing protein n=2 Tax=Curtobacterium pusillum TaxID=69373 RepID=A0AAW3T5Q3_9MICO|nr:hypothetical protein [Curtobacterium pusillum]
MKLAAMSRRSKPDFAAAIARQLDIVAPEVSRGSSVDTRFLERINEALTGQSQHFPNAYRATETVLSRLGLPYDHHWDTSEAQAESGGSTVTTRAYSRIFSALTGQARCFVLIGPESLPDQRRVLINRPKSRNALVEAGPGAMLLFASVADSGVSMRGGGECVRVRSHSLSDSVWQGPWTIEWDNEPYFQPGLVQLPPLHPTVIELDPSLVPASWTRPRPSDLVLSRQEEEARRIFDALMNAPIPRRQVRVPPVIAGELTVSPERVRQYAESGDATTTVSGFPSPPYSGHIQRSRARAVELRAVALVITSLEEDGWNLSADLQAAGEGFDLEFIREGRILHVEVKGLQGKTVTVNLTAKELWRARTDPHWVLIAVTEALSPFKQALHVIDRRAVCEAPRWATSYQLDLSR